MWSHKVEARRCLCAVSVAECARRSFAPVTRGALADGYHCSATIGVRAEPSAVCLLASLVLLPGKQNCPKRPALRQLGRIPHWHRWTHCLQHLHAGQGPKCFLTRPKYPPTPFNQRADPISTSRHYKFKVSLHSTQITCCCATLV